MEGDVVVLQDIYTFDFGMGIDEDGRFRGASQEHRHPAVVLRASRRLRHPARAVAVRGHAARRRGRVAADDASLDGPRRDSPAARRRSCSRLLHRGRVCSRLGARPDLHVRATTSGQASNERLGDLMQDPAPGGRRRRRSSRRRDPIRPSPRPRSCSGWSASPVGSPTGPACSPRTEDALEQADLPLRPPEALFFYFAGVFVVALLGSARAPDPGLALILHRGSPPSVPVDHGCTVAARSACASSRCSCPSTLNLLSGSMRAGFSFAQGLESVANEATEPTRRELQRVFTESRLGRPIEDALEDSAQPHDERRPDVGGHGHPHPARGRWKPGRAARHGRRHDDATGADPPRDQGAHRGRPLLRDRSSASSRSRSRACSTWSSPTT